MLTQMRIVNSVVAATFASVVSTVLYAQSAVLLTQPRSSTGDLTSIRVMDPVRHLVFRVYFDSASRRVAEKSMPTIADMYAMLARDAGADAGQVEWASVAFVTDRAYVPPRNADDIRWTVNVERSGELGAQGEQDLFVTVPHEQVHRIQGSLAVGAPRWFEEGQANWIGLRVTQEWRPSLAARERADLTTAYALVPRRLAAWGAIRVKPEVILRQMTAEQRDRMARDSTYVPPGPWKIGPSDLISDESELRARYGAALALFSTLEHARGSTGLVSWFQQLWAEHKPMSTDSLTASILVQFGLDVTQVLR